METVDRILALILKKSVTEQKFLSDLHFNRSLLSDWKSGKSRSYNKHAVEIATYFNVSTDYLLNGTSNVVDFPKHKGVKIPVLGRVVAGIPIEAVEEILDYEEIPQEWAERDDYFALSIKGNSMEPRIFEGDIAIVKVQPDIESGNLAIVLVNGQDATIKKVLKSAHGITLIPFNSNYEPMVFTNEEIEQLPVSIVGKVVEIRQKYN